MNCCVPQNAGNFLTSWATLSVSRRTLLLGVITPIFAIRSGPISWCSVDHQLLILDRTDGELKSVTRSLVMSRLWIPDSWNKPPWKRKISRINHVIECSDDLKFVIYERQGLSDTYLHSWNKFTKYIQNFSEPHVADWSLIAHYYFNIFSR
jgi:hypothetical protein